MAERREKYPDGYTACSTSTSEHHVSTQQKCQKFNVLLIVIGLIVTLVIAALIYVVIVNQRHETPDQSNQTCLKCQTLSTIVDKWAWKDVSEDKQKDTCCFNSDTGLSATLKYYFEKRISSSLAVTERLQENVDQLYTFVCNQQPSNRTNATSMTPFTHAKRSVLRLTSLNTVIAEGASLTVSWNSILQQGDVVLSNDTCSVAIMNTGLYYIYTQVKFRTNVINNHAMKAEVKFYIAVLRQGILKQVDDYKKQYVFRFRKSEHNANLHSITQLENGDSLIIRFPSSQKSYLATERGAHMISMFELS